MSDRTMAARLLPTFLGELEKQVRTLNTELFALEGQPTSAEHLKAVLRIAHTLKGEGRVAGVTLVEHTCHALETLLAEVREGTRSLGPDDFAVLFRAADALADAGQRLKAGGELSGSPLAELREVLVRRQANAIAARLTQLTEGGSDDSAHPRG